MNSPLFFSRSICTLCEDPEYLERHLELANMYGEANHRQLKKICS